MDGISIMRATTVVVVVVTIDDLAACSLPSFMLVLMLSSFPRSRWRQGMGLHRWTTVVVVYSSLCDDRRRSTVIVVLLWRVDVNKTNGGQMRAHRETNNPMVLNAAAALMH